jgi:hypothetical protein
MGIDTRRELTVSWDRGMYFMTNRDDGGGRRRDE